MADDPIMSKGRTGFHKRTDWVCVGTFVVVFVSGLSYGLRAKIAGAFATLAAFLVAGVWLIVVEDILSDKPRGH
jgi:hypothetical protein